MKGLRSSAGSVAAGAADVSGRDPQCGPLPADQASCCCPAAAFVRVLVPPHGERHRVIDLFLCAHHYRTSRDSLTGIGAVAFGRDGFAMTPRSALFIPCQDSKSRASAM